MDRPEPAYRRKGEYRAAFRLCVRYRLILKEGGGRFSLHYLRKQNGYTDVMHYADAGNVAELLAAVQAYGAQCEEHPNYMRHHGKARLTAKELFK